MGIGLLFRQMVRDLWSQKLRSTHIHNGIVHSFSTGCFLQLVPFIHFNCYHFICTITTI